MFQRYGHEKTEEIIQHNLNLSTSKLLKINEDDEFINEKVNNEKVNNEKVNNEKINNFDVALQSFKNKYNLLQIKKINEQHRLNKSNKRIIPPGINKYSPEYAQYIAPNRKVGVSANIRLGGVY